MAVNQSMFDRFSLVHFGAGMLKRHFGVTAGEALALAVAWEMVEDGLKDRFPQAFPNASHDSMRNSVGDVLSSMAGYYAVKSLKHKRIR